MEMLLILLILGLYVLFITVWYIKVDRKIKRIISNFANDIIEKVGIKKFKLFINDVTTGQEQINPNLFLFLIEWVIGSFLFIFAPSIATNISENKLVKFITSFLYEFVLLFSFLFVLIYNVSAYNEYVSLTLIFIFLIGSLVLTIILIKEGQIDENLFSLKNYFRLSFFIIISFAGIYYNLYKLNHNNFNTILSLKNSIYFSIITFATVGYGDILPTSDITKVFVSTEILSSILVLIFLASVFISRWAKEQK